MRILIILTVLSIGSMNVLHGQQGPDALDKSTALELPRIQVIPIKDTNMDRQYELYIKLPEEYEDSTHNRYPVIYYTDAMFHVEMLSGSADYIMEKAILVGISWQIDIAEGLINEYGSHVSRYRDYSIKPSSNPEVQAKHQLGQAKNHLEFIRQDVIDYVENNYRTTPGSRSYFGYSMGGMFGAYILLTQPKTFNNYILGSPSLRRNIAYLSELRPNHRLNANVFISHGSLEDELSVHVDEFISLLKNKNEEGLSLRHQVIEGTHQTAFPMTAVQGVTWLSNLTQE